MSISPNKFPVWFIAMNLLNSRRSYGGSKRHSPRSFVYELMKFSFSLTPMKRTCLGHICGSDSSGTRQSREPQAESTGILCAAPAGAAQDHPLWCAQQEPRNEPANSHQWSSQGESPSGVPSEWFWRGWGVASAAHTILQCHQWSPRSLRWCCHQRETHMIHSTCTKWGTDTPIRLPVLTHTPTSGSLFSSFRRGTQCASCHSLSAFRSINSSYKPAPPFSFAS